jgi:hypothetical protein
MRFSEFNIVESRTSPLYHVMDTDKALNVFTNDLMTAGWGHPVDRVTSLNVRQTRKAPNDRPRIWGNSFTRDPRLKSHYRIKVTIVVNQQRLNQTNKIVPVNGQRIYRGFSNNFPYRAIERDLSEEFVIGDIKNLHRVIDKIIIMPTNANILKNREKSLNGKDEILKINTNVEIKQENRLYQVIKDYAKRWNIKLEVQG